MLYLEMKDRMSRFVLCDERYEEIKMIVVDMFEKCGVSCVPISGFEIAIRMGVTVIPYSVYDKEIRHLMLKRSTDGFSIIDHGKYTIFYNDTKGYGRINNTMMHEIGHVILGHLEDSELAEAEVRFFAKYALAPPVLIHKLKLTSPKEIARVFDISLEAAQYAYDYYQKWLLFGSRDFTSYEIRTLSLFEKVVTVDCV